MHFCGATRIFGGKGQNRNVDNGIRMVRIEVKVKVKVKVLSLDPKLVLTTLQFYLAGHWKWPHSYILSFTGSKF